jgi:hypothetical protein
MTNLTIKLSLINFDHRAVNSRNDTLICVVRADDALEAARNMPPGPERDDP